MRRENEFVLRCSGRATLEAARRTILSTAISTISRSTIAGAMSGCGRDWTARRAACSTLPCLRLWGAGPNSRFIRLGALNNGVTEQELAEILLQAGVYAGVPVASEGFRTAFRVIEKHRQSLTPAGSAGKEWAKFLRSHEQDVMSWNSHFDRRLRCKTQD